VHSFKRADRAKVTRETAEQVEKQVAIGRRGGVCLPSDRV